MDRLTPLFASKPTSQPGFGVMYNGDTRGNGVPGLRQEQPIVTRFPSNEPAAAAVVSYTHNWQPTKVTASTLTINPGVAVGGYPTIGGTSIIDGPTLTVSGSTFYYVYLKVTVTLTTVSGYVTGMTVTGRVITAETTTKSSTSTDRYFLLFTWQSGALVQQLMFWNFDMDAVDDGTSTSTPTFRTWPSA